MKIAPDSTHLIDHVAGLPFTKVDPNDKQAGAKHMFNFNAAIALDDLDLRNFDCDTGALGKNGDPVHVERHFLIDHIRRLYFRERVMVDPKPEMPSRDGARYKEALYPLIEPFDLKGTGFTLNRYADYTRQDDTWLYLPTLRRVRRLSSAQRSDALCGQDIDVDSYGGYAGQIPWFDWKLIGEKPMLASLHGKRLPPEPCKKDGGMTFCESWEMRPSVYIIEGRPKVQGYAYSKRLIYVDKETNFIIYSDLFDQNEELWKVVMQSIRTSTRPNPNVAYEYPEPRMFIYAFSVIDMQLMHGTRAAIPGLAFQDEPGWYIDIGFDKPQSATEDWFKVAGLIGGGR